jgi:hypothetical protein
VVSSRARVYIQSREHDAHARRFAPRDPGIGRAGRGGRAERERERRGECNGGSPLSRRNRRSRSFIIVISLFHGAAGGEDNRPRTPLSRSQATPLASLAAPTSNDYPSG